MVKALNKHIPLKKLKFDKYKHEKSNWITTGIIKSIKFRDGLYKRLKQFQQNSIEYFNNKQNLTAYNKILRHCIRNAKASYFSMKFKKC